jgi:large subunit ribosomal protein L25
VRLPKKTFAMKSVPLNAFGRSVNGRAEVKKLRDAGRIPATIYGRQTKPENLELVGREMTDLINHSLSENILVDLNVDKKKRLALVQEVQHHPLSGKVLHIDFHEVAENEMVTVMVPVETTGEPVGVKTGGGVLEHIVFKLKVRALPKNLPEQILIDVSALEVGKSIHLGEVKAPEGVEIMGRKSTTVVAVAMPKTEVEAAPAEGAAAAAGDVEMTKEKKEDGTAAPAAKAGDKPAAGKADAKDAKAAAPAKK